MNGPRFAFTFRDTHRHVRLAPRPELTPDPGTAWRLHLARIMLPVRVAHWRAASLHYANDTQDTTPKTLDRRRFSP